MNSQQQQIVDYARRNGADPYTMLATAQVESGLNPQAVGDNGTSFGLYQMHVGGAGGPTLSTARQYLDPVKTLQNRSRAFKGGSGGAFAASVQRPADAAGYARKVDSAIAQLKQHGLDTGGSQQPWSVPSSGTNDSAALNFILQGSPFAGLAQMAAPQSAAAPSIQPQTTSGKPAATGFKQLQKLGQQLFGLRNDPGTSQTTGGHHTAGSEHYSGRAVDFGNALNSQDQLNAWYNWAKSHGYDVLNEGDHIHVSVPGGGT